MCSPQDIEYFHNYLTSEEICQICRQFHKATWLQNNQVMWSGVPRATAQEWADEHHMQTLTAAMGPLMIHDHPECLRSSKSGPGKWSKYMQGASALFAYHIAQGEGTVTVLTPPPPERFHPSGETNYQAIEEPILQGKVGGKSVSQIKLVHPIVTGARDFGYQFWPVDETDCWASQFGELTPQHRLWRPVKKKRWKL